MLYVKRSVDPKTEVYTYGMSQKRQTTSVKSLVVTLVFEKFQNFSNYTVVNLLDKSQDITPGNMYIIISSIELLVKESTDGSRKIMEKILLFKY